MDKRVATVAAALADIKDGSTILLGGFGAAGEPAQLLDALREQGARDLTVVVNNSGVGEEGLAGLIKARRVKKLICSFPRSEQSYHFATEYRAGRIELEVVPQGTLSERMRAAAAGIGGFFVRTAVGTPLAEGKEVREIEGETYVFEKPIKGDVALVRAFKGDRWGNLTYRKAARNFNPVVAMAAALTIAQVAEIVELGTLDPENIHTPGIFVDRVVVA